MPLRGIFVVAVSQAMFNCEMNHSPEVVLCWDRCMRLEVWVMQCVGVVHIPGVWIPFTRNGRFNS